MPSRVRINVDTTIGTDINVQYNKPDTVVHNKDLNEITNVDVRTTAIDRLQTAEAEKARKYDLLADEPGETHTALYGTVIRLHKRNERMSALTSALVEKRISDDLGSGRKIVKQEEKHKNKREDYQKLPLLNLLYCGCKKPKERSLCRVL